MNLKELFENWILNIVSSALGVALIYFALDIKTENSFYWIPLFTGIIFQIPMAYFKIWGYIRDN